MPEIQKLSAASALEVLRATIQDAKGNEVFFLAYTDEAGMIKEVLPLARGNDSAVPALMQVSKSSDVILHNHPSGLLTPSSALPALTPHYQCYSSTMNQSDCQSGLPLPCLFSACRGLP